MTLKITNLKQRIKEIQKELAQLGPMRPGSLMKQYNVCGTPGCRCKDPKNPRKHGPYYNIKYTWKGKARTQFVKADAVEEVERQLETYKRFRALTQEWVDLSVEVVFLEKKGRDG